VLRKSIIRHVRKISKSYYSSCLSVRIDYLGCHWKDFMKFHIWFFFQTLSRKFKLPSNLSIITGSILEDQHTFKIISRSILLKVRNVSYKICRESQTYSLCSLLFFFFNPAVYDSMWKNTVEPEWPQMTIWRTRVACWIPNLTNTLSEYVFLNAFPLQRWFNARFSMLSYTYIACLVFHL
jgi:hypothetical protein